MEFFAIDNIDRHAVHNYLLYIEMPMKWKIGIDFCVSLKDLSETERMAFC